MSRRNLNLKIEWPEIFEPTKSDEGLNGTLAELYPDSDEEAAANDFEDWVALKGLDSPKEAASE